MKRPNHRTGLALTAAAALGAGLIAAAPAADAATIHPNTTIEERACSSSNETWVQIVFANKTECFGYAGTIGFSGNSAEYLCSGNNYGSVSYNDGSGEQTDSFSPGEDIYFPAGTSVLSLKIIKWSGSSIC